MFLDQHPSGKCFGIVSWEDGHFRLGQRLTAIQSLVYQMDRAPGY